MGKGCKLYGGGLNHLAATFFIFAK